MWGVAGRVLALLHRHVGLRLLACEWEHLARGCLGLPARARIRFSLGRLWLASLPCRAPLCWQVQQFFGVRIF